MHKGSRTLLIRLFKTVTLLILASIVFFKVCCVVWSSKAVPTPEVALDFRNFISEGTNAYAILSFTNRGRTEVWLWDSTQLWQLVAETTAGWITNTASFATVGGERILPASNKVFAVPIPHAAIRWRITTIYGFQEKHHLPSEFSGWVWKSPLLQRGPEPISDAILWCLDLLPNPPPCSHSEVCTPLLTNRPSQL